MIVRFDPLRDVALAGLLLLAAGPSAGDAIRPEDGRRVSGAVLGDRRAGFRFVPEGGGTPLRLEAVGAVELEGRGPDRSASPPPFSVVLGDGQRVSGRLGRLAEGAIRLESGPDGLPIDFARRGVLALVQRPGEATVLFEAFDRLDKERWKAGGGAEVGMMPGPDGSTGLRLPASGGSVTWEAPEPVPAGRFEVRFADEGRTVAGRRLIVEWRFRTPGGTEPVAAVLGWEEEGLAVRSRSGGPALAVQRLPRRPGRHLLGVRFGPDRLDLDLDGDELAHGDSPGGPLIGLRLAAEGTGPEPPDDLAAWFDDLRIVRSAAPPPRVEVDPEQDEARLVTGDQLFGRVVAADAQGVRLDVDGRRAALGWDEVAGLHLRRAPGPSKPIDGLWVRLSWRGAGEPDAIEGALERIDAMAVTLSAPYAGPVTVPRALGLELRVLGRFRRTVLDPFPHHLGKTRVPDLDPPQPEGGVLEIPFTLDAAPAGRAYLRLSVVQVVGVEGNPAYSPNVRGGELRTHLALNGRRFDTLNRHVTTRNDTPARLRIPIPEGLLRPGANVLRFEQEGMKEDPEKLDNLGLWGVAIEADRPQGGGGGS